MASFDLKALAISKAVLPCLSVEFTLLLTSSLVISSSIHSGPLFLAASIKGVHPPTSPLFVGSAPLSNKYLTNSICSLSTAAPRGVRALPFDVSPVELTSAPFFFKKVFLPNPNFQLHMLQLIYQVKIDGFPFV